MRAFPAGALRPQLSRGRSGAPPRGWWPSGLASVSEAGGPGLGSPLARALFCVAVSWLLAAGSFFVAAPWISAPAARNRGAASEVASRSAIAQFMLQKSTFEAFSCKSRQAAPADDVVRRHADFLQCSIRSVFLRGFAQSRRRSLMLPLLFLWRGTLRRVACRLFLIACCLLPATRAHGCCCSQPFASRRARLFLPHGFHRAPPQIRFSKLRRQLIEAGPW